MRTLDCTASSFDDWVRAVFAQPVADSAYTYWYSDVDFREPGPKTALEHVTRLFNNPSLLEDYLDRQVADGLL